MWFFALTRHARRRAGGEATKGGYKIKRIDLGTTFMKLAAIINVNATNMPKNTGCTDLGNMCKTSHVFERVRVTTQMGNSNRKTV